MRWARGKSEAQSRRTGRRESSDGPEVAALAVDQMWPVMWFDLTLKRAPTPCHTLPAWIGKRSSLLTAVFLLALCHVTQMLFVPPTFVCLTVRAELFPLCWPLHFLLNIASILVSVCLWFDIVSAGVTLGCCAFSQVSNQYWLAVICYWSPLSWFFGMSTIESLTYDSCLSVNQITKHSLKILTMCAQ